MSKDGNVNNYTKYKTKISCFNKHNHICMGKDKSLNRENFYHHLKSSADGTCHVS